MTNSWHQVASADEIEVEDVIQVKVLDKVLAVYNAKGNYYATHDLCTHGHACLSDGVVIGDRIECPLHQGRFHIPSGKPDGAPVSIPIETFPVKVVDGQIYVQIVE